MNILHNATFVTRDFAFISFSLCPLRSFSICRFDLTSMKSSSSLGVSMPDCLKTRTTPLCNGASTITSSSKMFLMLMYARFGNAESCLFIFQKGNDGNLSMWNAVISVHLKLNDAISAFSFFIDLLRREKEPDYVTFLGVDKYVAINNALIDLYARCGNISVARKLFELSPEKDSVSWSVMINGYGLHGNAEAALALLSHMKLSGMKPDDIVYLNILSACSHAGLVDQGRTVFHTMIHDGILPRMEHYACFVDLLGRTGYLDEAYDILKSLPCKLSVNLLDSLLGACLTHGNIQLGEELRKLVPDMKSRHSGLYVILHNIYAAAGRWTDATRLRIEMEEKQLTKVAGISFVEGNGS